MDPAMTSLLGVVIPILITTLGAAYTNAKSATKTSVRDLENREKILVAEIATLTADRNTALLREIDCARHIARLEAKIGRLEVILERYGWKPIDECEDGHAEAPR